MNMNMNYSYLLNMKVPRNHGSRNTTTGAMSNLTLSLFSLAFSNSEARDHLNDGIKGGSPTRWQMVSIEFSTSAAFSALSTKFMCFSSAEPRYTHG